jgi:hypothetical protein
VSHAPLSRREFMAGVSLGWLPFFRPGHVELAGARFQILRNGGAPRRYLVIHGNERTAARVLRRHMETREGIAFLIESQTRNAPALDGVVDPNRMFSRVGAEANLKKLNPAWPAGRVEAALRLLDAGRERLLRALLPPPGGLLFALHNNSEGYSVADEAPISDERSLRQPDAPRAFFLATDPADFKILAGSGFNAVLQRNGPEDGSLSRLAATRGVRYVNLETPLGDEFRQLEMLEWADWALPARR